MFVRWTSANQGLNLGHGDGVREVSLGGKPPVAYAIVDGMGLYVSKNLGQSWSPFRGAAAWLKDPYAVAASPADGNLVYGGGKTVPGLWRSNDAGASWTHIADHASGLADDFVEWIAMSPADPQVILVGHTSGSAISVSTDAGKTWRASPLGAEIKRQVPVIVGPKQWAVVSRAKAAIYCTEDGGQTWAAASGNTDYFAEPLPVIHLDQYLFTSSHHGTNKSTDGGKSWNYSMERHARVIGTLGRLLVREDRAEIRGKPARKLAINVSSDYANSWEEVTGWLVRPGARGVAIADHHSKQRRSLRPRPHGDGLGRRRDGDHRPARPGQGRALSGHAPANQARPADRRGQGDPPGDRRRRCLDQALRSAQWSAPQRKPQSRLCRFDLAWAAATSNCSTTAGTTTGRPATGCLPTR